MVRTRHNYKNIRGFPENIWGLAPLAHPSAAPDYMIKWSNKMIKLLLINVKPKVKQHKCMVALLMQNTHSLQLRFLRTFNIQYILLCVQMSACVWGAGLQVQC